MRRFLLAALCAAAACARPTPADGPPGTEFLLGSADSTYWVAATGGELHVRGAPIMLARYGGRFYELYTADDDFSYDDALLLGQRLYRRDIATGDSLVLFADTTVARIATAYARSHPDEEPLGPDDEGEANPSTTATADISVLGVYGPYVSYEYHVDVDLSGSRPWHTTRRAVVDLRNGAAATVGDLFGATEAHALAAAGRRTYESTRDSIVAQRNGATGDDRRGIDALLRLQFDERSFSLVDVGGRPAVEFDVPGRGQGPAGNVLELDPVPVQSVAWWEGVSATLPQTTVEGEDRWTRGQMSLLARYDTSGEIARLSLADNARREWPVATVLGPLRQVIWLDAPPLADSERVALRRAFNAAASYDEAARVASLDPLRRASGATRPIMLAAYAPIENRSRKSARDVRAHDAGARQQHGARLRRRHSLDDGQGGGDRRLSSQPRERRHRFDRSRGLSRADSPRRPGRHEGERQLRRTVVDGGRRPR
jgi:hypothetical protein